MATVTPSSVELLQIAPLHRFSSGDYLEMIEKGVLGRHTRVELVGGYIVNMSPQGSRHNYFLGCLNRLAVPLHDRFFVLVQGTLTVSEGQIFDPDFLLLRQKPEAYKQKLPDASDVHLVVEAADSSLRFDKQVKLPVYAAAGIPEYWIVDVERELIVIHRDPVGATYKLVETRQGDDIVSPLGAPEFSFAVRQAFE
jgi:Uma2 family endonuclease